MTQKDVLLLHHCHVPQQRLALIQTWRCEVKSLKIAPPPLPPLPRSSTSHFVFSRRRAHDCATHSPAAARRSLVVARPLPLVSCVGCVLWFQGSEQTGLHLLPGCRRVFGSAKWPALTSSVCVFGTCCQSYSLLYNVVKHGIISAYMRSLHATYDSRAEKILPSLPSPKKKVFGTIFPSCGAESLQQVKRQRRHRFYVFRQIGSNKKKKE